MKRISGFFIALILSTVVYSVMAQNGQNNQNNQSDQNALRNVAEQSTYGDNWFISFGGNANLLTAEQDGAISIDKRIKYGGALTFGKWFNPNFGMRLQLMGGSLRGFNYINDRTGFYIIPGEPRSGGPDQHPEGGPYYLPNPDNPDAPINYDNPPDNSKYTFHLGPEGFGFWQDFNYASATFDFMANLTSLFRGRYVEHNPIDIVPFLGLGVIHAFDNNVTTPGSIFLAIKVGFRVNVNLSSQWSIYIEPQGTATDKKFDGYIGDAMGDGVANISFGLQYTFNKKFTTQSQLAQLTADEIDRLNKKINDNRYLIENHQDIIERQQNLLDRLQKGSNENRKEVQSTQVSQFSQGGGASYLPDYIRFALDSYEIDPTEQYKITQVADYLKKHEKSKLLVIGYADRKTGNPDYNMKLSRSREEAVSSELRRLGILSNRVISEWRGDKEQPFPQSNEWNRVVVMVERK